MRVPSPAAGMMTTTFIREGKYTGGRRTNDKSQMTNERPSPRAFQIVICQFSLRPLPLLARRPLDDHRLRLLLALVWTRLLTRRQPALVEFPADHLARPGLQY